jgi:hypothetical protein
MGPSLGDQLFRDAPLHPIKPGQSTQEWFLETLDPHFVQKQKMESWCFGLADSHCSTAGLKLDEPSRRILAEAIARAIQRASITLKRYEEGDYRTTQDYPSIRRPSKSHHCKAAVPAMPSRNRSPSLSVTSLKDG